MRVGLEWLRRGRRRMMWLACATPVALGSVDGHHLSMLPDAPGPRGEPTVEQAAIERQPVCIGSSVASAGALSDVLYYRAVETDDGHVNVGYFVFFSEERPWGNNWLTWSVLPALAVDFVYSRALFVAPGLQRLISGLGDVEGLGIVYAKTPDGGLRLEYAVADDGKHEDVQLSRDQAFALDPDRPTFYTSVWSHQLGGRGARSREDLAYVRCYDAGAIRPLPDGVARLFRLDGHGRAPPAHVEETVGARRLDVTPARAASGSPPAGGSGRG